MRRSIAMDVCLDNGLVRRLLRPIFGLPMAGLGVIRPAKIHWIVAWGVVAICAAVAQTVVADAPEKADVTASAAVPADRVVVMYFHRTQRCPTCLKMGGYSEEAVKKGFAKELAEGKVEFHYVDFQDEKNAALTKGYQVAGPTLIVAKVVDNKVAERKNLKEMWTKVREKDAFIEYVQSNVKDCQK